MKFSDDNRIIYNAYKKQTAIIDAEENVEAENIKTVRQKCALSPSILTYA